MTIQQKDKRGARYRRISIEMYADARFKKLSPPKPSAQSLWIYLLTGPFSTLIPGICVGGEAGIAERLLWPLAAFRQCFKEITDLGMALSDWTGPVIFMPKALKHNPPQNPSVVAGWRQAWLEVPACDLKDTAAQNIRAVLVAQGAAFGAAFDGIAGTHHLPTSTTTSCDTSCGDIIPPHLDTHLPPHQEQEQDQEQEIPPTPRRGARSTDPRKPHSLDEGRVLLSVESLAAFDALYAIYPRKDARKRGSDAWRDLNPDADLASHITARVRERLAAGWADSTELRFLPTLATFLDEHRWQDPVVLPRAVASSGMCRNRHSPPCADDIACSQKRREELDRQGAA